MKGKHSFVVQYPKFIFYIGVLCNIVFIIVLLGFTLFSKQLPHLIFYIFCAMFLSWGTYLILKGCKFKVIVTGLQIAVFPVFKKSYTFSFIDIVEVRRQVKKNQMKSERIVIKTKFGQKLVLESQAIAYNMFVVELKDKVNHKYLFGF